jgi:hypothetical protein
MMTRSSWRPAALTALALSTCLLAACSGDDVLAPPDGVGCTAGTVSPGDSVKGAVTSTSCEVFDVSNYRLTYAESWTLNVKKGTAYVIRVRHESAPEMADNIDYDLHVFGRNAHGDATFLTGWWDSFGNNNGNGGQNQELFFTATSDRALSLRISADTKADTGAYSLTVHSCPLVFLTAPKDTVEVDLSKGCEALSLDFAQLKASFFAFQTDSSVQDTTWITRVAGDAYFVSHTATPGYDVNCWNSDCTSINNSWATAITNRHTPAVPTYTVGWAAVHTDSAATVQIAVSGTPPSTPPAFVPAPSARIKGRSTGRN